MATAQQPGTNVVRTVANTNVPRTISESELARNYITPLLPHGVTLEQVGAQVRLALAKDKSGALQKCTVGSVVLAVAKIVGWGLVVGETAHLVPYGTECQAQRDYTGDIQLAIESGMVRRVNAQVVYENEPLVIKRGSRLEIEHHPIFDPKSRGPMVGVYTILHLRGGDIETEYMTYEEVDAIRQAHSKQWKSGPVPRWYMKKTCIRQSLKLIPKTPKLLAILAKIDQEEAVNAAALDEALAAVELPAGEDPAPLTHTIEHRNGPRPLATSGAEPYDAGRAVNEAPIPPALHSDDPGFTDGESFEDGFDLDDERPAQRRSDAIREG
jgi:phage RecT family recombinase